jgi:hypothetical protein
MATKTRLFLIASLPLVIAMTLGVLAMLPPSPGVTKAHFDRIEKGMTLGQVEQILGGTQVPYKGWLWTADDGSWAVIAFENDCVAGKEWHDSAETIPDKIRRWLHLR